MKTEILTKKEESKLEKLRLIIIVIIEEINEEFNKIYYYIIFYESKTNIYYGFNSTWLMHILLNPYN